MTIPKNALRVTLLVCHPEAGFMADRVPGGEGSRSRFVIPNGEAGGISGLTALGTKGEIPPPFGRSG